MQRLTLIERHKDFSSVSSCLDISQQCAQIHVPSCQHHLSVLNMSTMQTYMIHRNGFCTNHNPTGTPQVNVILTFIHLPVQLDYL